MLKKIAEVLKDDVTGITATIGENGSLSIRTGSNQTSFVFQNSDADTACAVADCIQAAAYAARERKALPRNN